MCIFVIKDYLLIFRKPANQLLKLNIENKISLTLTVVSHIVKSELIVDT